MSKAKGNPANQPFNVSGRRNLTKTRSWWYRNPPQNNTQPKGATGG